MAENRVTLTKKGKIDEVVTDGGAHLEHLGNRRWFLSMQRADGSSVCMWITGKITGIEERTAPFVLPGGFGWWSSIPCSAAPESPHK